MADPPTDPPDDVDTLARELARPARRTAAARRLARLARERPERVVPAAAALLGCVVAERDADLPDETVLRAVGTALGHAALADADLLPVLSTCVRAQTYADRRAGTRALATLVRHAPVTPGADRPPPVDGDDLANRLSDDGATARDAAEGLLWLARTWADVPPVAPLADALGVDEPGVRRRAAFALGYVGRADLDAVGPHRGRLASLASVDDTDAALAARLALALVDRGRPGRSDPSGRAPPAVQPSLRDAALGFLATDAPTAARREVAAALLTLGVDRAVVATTLPPSVVAAAAVAVERTRPVASRE